MDGHRFDNLARALAGATSRRGLLRGAIGAAAAALLGNRIAVEAACPAGQISRRGLGCVCRATGRPSGPSGCPGPATVCAAATTRCAGQCVDTRSSLDHCGACGESCHPAHACETCACQNGVCARTPVACPPPRECQIGPGVCDRATGFCGYAARTGEVCGAEPACANGVLTARGACDDVGVCQPSAPTACSPYACASVGAACRTGCGGDADCALDHHCDAGVCLPDLGKGAGPCDEDDDCATGLVCSLPAGVCCDAPCDDDCHTCTLLGSVGTCLPLSGTPCDDGDDCTTADVCRAGACQPGTRAVCGPCAVCDRTNGQCLPANGGDPCDDGNRCTGAGVCDGGACQPGELIACPSPTHECLAAGVCDPAAGCAYPPRTGEPCGPAQSCANGVQTDRGACDDQGGCLPGRQTPCTPYVCGLAACLDRCAGDGDCLPAYRCAGGACLPDVTLGGACERPGDCAEGLFCVTPSPEAPGVCCNEPCTDQCFSCAVENSVGTCVALNAGTCNYPDNCVETGRCAAGVCVLDTTVDCGPCGVCDPSDGGCLAANGGDVCLRGDGTGPDGICCDGDCIAACTPPLVSTENGCGCVCPPCENGATPGLDCTCGVCAAVADGAPCDASDPCGDVCLGGACTPRAGCGECHACNAADQVCEPAGGGPCTGGACCASGACRPTCGPRYVFDPVDCACDCLTECCVDAACGDCGICGDSGACTSRGCPTCYACNTTDQTCDPIGTAVCTPADGGPDTGTCCNGGCCGPDETCDGAACVVLADCIPPCNACEVCNIDDGQCLPASGVCTPPSGVANSGICCNGGCCAPGTMCNGAACVPHICPKCQEFGATAGLCIAIGNGTLCFDDDGFRSTCCEGACCGDGRTCVSGACCDNFLACGAVCCPLCAPCLNGTCTPLREGDPCTFFDGNRYTCCDGVCCQDGTCSAGVCDSPFPL